MIVKDVFIMEKIDILEQQLLQVPLAYKEEMGFYKASVEVLEQYIELVEKYEFSENIIKNLTDFRKYYEEMLKCYYKGQHARAYAEFKTALKHLNFNDSKFIVPLGEMELYRARLNDKQHRSFGLDDMWHIPFYLRGKVNTERFSFPGLPCLYFGSSTYSCWIEMDRPSFSEFQIARFETTELAKTVYVLDISVLANKVEKLVHDNVIELEEYILIWPIIAMCSFHVLNRDSVFKPEYIFPQFLMEYVSSKVITDKIVVGIKYASTRAPSDFQYTSAERTYSCFVFPSSQATDTETIDENLKKYFSAENTLSGMSLISQTNFFKYETCEYFEELKEKYTEDIYFGELNALSYDGTQFLEFECLLGLSSWMGRNS